LACRPLHLAAHLDMAVRDFEHIYGVRPPVDERAVTREIASLLRARRVPPKGSATVMLYLVPQDGYELRVTSHGNDEGGDGLQNPAKLTVEYERTLLDAGYTLSSLRPRAVSFDYSIPFGGFPTAFQLSARALYDTLGASRTGNSDYTSASAANHRIPANGGTVRSVRREGDRLLSCGDAPLFAIRGKKLFTPPLTEGAMESVERQLIIEAAAQERFTLTEETLRHSELREYDELFCVDAAGITSLAECDGAKFMSLAAPRLAAAMNGISLRED
jgi:hypothetical protein